MIKLSLKVIFGVLFLGIGLIFLTGCSKELENEEKEHVMLSVKQGEDMVVDTSLISNVATYYNYEIDDYIIQMFVVKGSDGKIRIVFNTCGSCNPAPLSYFIQKGNYFECQNCLNKFHIDEIGLTRSFGCSPIAILDEDKIVDEDKIIIKSEFIEKYKEKFKTIDIVRI